MFNLSKAAKVTRVSNAVAAGTSDIESTAVDMKGFGAVQFIVALGTITTAAVTVAKLQGSSDNVTFNDLEGSGQAIADDGDNKLVVLDLALPQHRYIKCVVDRGVQNAVVDDIIALQYLADKEPVTHATSVLSSKLTHAPAAGTA
jgi:hypothetical protein